MPKNVDDYPLMGVFYGFNVTWQEETYHVNVVSNSTVSDFDFGEFTNLETEESRNAIHFHVTGPQDTVGFCRIRIPRALLNDTYKVFANWTGVPHSILPCSNITHSYLYFTYNHPTQEVVIIPEFPSILILPLFMTTTLLAVIAYRRKHSM